MKTDHLNLERFKEAQEKNYADALNEIHKGKKTSHWMWYVFPQLQGLGKTETARFFGIADLEEAEAYLNDPILKKRLERISEALLQHKNKSANEILGKPDDLKLRSCMTLFSIVPDASPVFQEVLNVFFEGNKDNRTLELLQK